MPLARPGNKDRDLTQGQWRTLFRSFMNAREGKAISSMPTAEASIPFIGYQLEDYERNVGPGEYDHKKYLDYLIKNKNLDKNLLNIIPRIEY